MPRFTWTLTGALAALGRQTATAENDAFVSSRSRGTASHTGHVTNVTAISNSLGQPKEDFS